MQLIPSMDIRLDLSLETLPISVQKYSWEAYKPNIETKSIELTIRLILRDGKYLFFNFKELMGNVGIVPGKITSLMENPDTLRTYFQGIWSLGLRMPPAIHQDVMYKVSQMFFYRLRTFTAVGHYKKNPVIGQYTSLEVTNDAIYVLTKKILGCGAKRTFTVAVNVKSPDHTFPPYAFSAVCLGYPNKNGKIYTNETFEKELKIFSLLKKNPSIVHLVDHSVYVGSKGKRAWILLEYCNKGNLEDLNDNDSTLWENQNLYCIAFDCLDGLIALEKAGIVHGDIKMGNILIHQEDNSVTYRAKIADFDLATFIDDPVKDTESGHGSLDYIPPNYVRAFRRLDALRKLKLFHKEDLSALQEIDKEIGELQKLEIRTFKNDLWSFGAVLYGLCNRGQLLYELDYLTSREMVEYIANFTQEDIEIRFPSELTPVNSFNELVKRMLTIDIRFRPTAKECLVYLKKLMEYKVPFEFVKMKPIDLTRQVNINDFSIN